MAKDQISFLVLYGIAILIQQNGFSLISDSTRLKEVDIHLMKVSGSTACGSFDNS